MNYTTLQTAVADYIHRSDLNAKIPTFIALAESYLFREMHIKELQISTTGTTLTDGYCSLPSDFGSVSKITITSNGQTITLDYVAVPNITNSSSDTPNYYSLENNQIRIYGASVGQSFILYYIPNIQPLSGTVSTNWLLTNAQELYLYGACLEAARYIRNDAEVAKLTQAVTMALDSVKRFSERRGQPATGSMQIKVRRG